MIGLLNLPVYWSISRSWLQHLIPNLSYQVTFLYFSCSVCRGFPIFFHLVHSLARSSAATSVVDSTYVSVMYCMLSLFVCWSWFDKVSLDELPHVALAILGYLLLQAAYLTY